MWFLIKGSFWFSLVLITLPFLDQTSREALEDAPPLEVGQSMAAAVEALEDISGIAGKGRRTDRLPVPRFQVRRWRTRPDDRLPARRQLSSLARMLHDEAMAGDVRPSVT